MSDQPPPKFQRFERVCVSNEPHHYPELLGKWGTILWRDAISARLIDRPHLRGSRWMYLVYFGEENVYRTLLESDIQSEGGFEAESAHLGTRPEFSFDIIMDEDKQYVEGTYRLPGKFWEVLIVRKADVPALQHRPSRPPIEWASGITGVIIDVPREDKLNREYVRNALASVFGYTDWVEVAGPDSMILR
jgi:hypothetical protein